nr:reverse transcriptase domain-containing protein [Tanacetum cinerariifolium]
MTSDSRIRTLTNDMAEIKKVLFQRHRGAFSSNTQPNTRADIKVITTRSGIVLDGPSVLLFSSSKEVKRDSETNMDPVLTKSTIRVSPPVVKSPRVSRSSVIPPLPISSYFELPKRNPHQPLIHYPSRLNKEKLQDKSDIQVHKFLQMYKKLHFNISLAEALALMPKYHKILKDLLSDKEKLLGLANTYLTENCSVVLLKMLPEKLRDHGKFLIPCDFPEPEKCMALADLGANISLIPLSIWRKLILPELVPTCMTLELANRSLAYPAGIVEDVCVQVGKFTFSADFIVVDYDVDPRVPLILRRPFLRKTRALVDVYGKELILRDVLKIKKSNHPLSGSTTSLPDSSPSLTPIGISDSLFEEFADELALLDPFPPRNKEDNFDPETDLRKIEYLLNRDPLTDSSPMTDFDNIDPILERLTDERAHVYSSTLGDDDDDLFDFKFDNGEWRKLLYGDSFNDIHTGKDKTKDSKIKILIDEFEYLESNVLLPQIRYDREDLRACFQSSNHSVSDHLHVYV